MTERSLLMIPGPIEVSRRVVAAAAKHPSSHVAPQFIESMGRSLENMRHVWQASEDSQPFIVAGSGTLAMEMAVYNILGPNDHALVVSSGYFSDRIAEMIRRTGAQVTIIAGSDGKNGYFKGPDLDAVEQELSKGLFKVVAATHVDTSTGVRVDAARISSLASAYGAMSIFDGVCATAAERFEMKKWRADIYLTASQKAIGLPPGLALLVVSPTAMRAREAMDKKPPMFLDWHEWLPIMKAYEARKPSYFATPATSLVAALDVALQDMLTEEGGMESVLSRHERSASAMRAAWTALDLKMVPEVDAERANTLSAIRYPQGLDSSLLAEIAGRGVVVAGGLHPACKDQYFRVGHMGDVLHRPADLSRTVQAISEALVAKGHACDGEEAIRQLNGKLG